MTPPRLELTRAQVIARRLAAGALDARLPAGTDSFRRAAWAGLQDSMPRAALLSLHARVEAIGASAWEDPSLVQVWGPRFSAYVVAAADRTVFTLGRLPDDPHGRRRAEDLADRLEAFLDGRRMRFGEAGHALGGHPNQLRYATATGRVLIRWDGARQPTIWTEPTPVADPREARLELLRRYLRIFGPTTAASFAEWAGIAAADGRDAFDALGGSLVPVRSPIGEAWILAEDELAFGNPAGPAAPARLLPSGDAFFLLWGADREVLVPEAVNRAALWPPRVWPGAVLVDGEIAGTWRRSNADLTIHAWRALPPAARAAVEAEAVALPLPSVDGRIRVRWAD